MSNSQLEQAIEAAWEARDTLSSATTGEMREAIEETLNALDGGTLRVAEKQESGDWHVNQWAKKAVLLGFRIQDMAIQDGGPQGGGWWIRSIVNLKAGVMSNGMQQGFARSQIVLFVSLLLSRRAWC